MRLLVLMLSMFFAQSLAADGPASATIFLSVSLDASEAPEPQVIRNRCSSEALCEKAATDYYIEEDDSQLRATADTLVHVTRVTVIPI